MAPRPSSQYRGSSGIAARILALLLTLPWISMPGWAQSAPAKSASAANSGSPDGGPRLGFSIESEMLTYRALEANSEAVACDVAAFLNGTIADFSHPPTGAICDVGGAASKSGVIIAPFDRTLFDAFQFWRAKMEVMRELQSRAIPYKCESAPLAIAGRGSSGGGGKSGGGAAAAGAVKSALDLTPIGAALQLSESVLGMFAQTPVNTAVAGTIEDQAFIDGVARELRSLNVPVLAPATYPPFGFSPVDVESSPFLVGINRLIGTRICLADKEAAAELGPVDKALVRGLLGDIAAYMAGFGGALSSMSADGSAAGGPSKTTSDKSGGSGKPEAPTAVGMSAITPLMTMLAGDDLARTLRVDPKTGQVPATTPWRHVLLLKALESGGTVESKSNIFGARVRYSGGSVGTYAMFSLDGRLECSGNVYEFGGSIPAESFQRDLRNYRPDPQSQFIFSRGGCHASAEH
jgi:hypothetical protein